MSYSIAPAASYRALLVDLDGVIRLWPAREEGIEDAHGLPRGALQQAAFDAGLLNAAISGLISHEVWMERAAAELQRLCPGARSDDAIAAWGECVGTINKEALEIVARSRRKLKIVLVTNATSRLSADLERLALAEHFDQVVNSSQIGVVKPAERFYLTALEMARCAAHEALFVDDTAANVAAAEALGVCAHRFVSIEALRDWLARRGVL